MNKSSLFTLLFISISSFGFSQSNALSSSPYSLYGMGLFNESNTGKTLGLGSTGIANTSEEFINNSNPASLSKIPLNTFFFDVGFKSEYGIMVDSGTQESKITGNFSNVAFAFPINKKSGLSVTLMPYTNVGYNIKNIETGIDGTTNSFFSTIDGKGGINSLNLSYGYAFGERLSLGLSTSLLFGQIIETEYDIIGASALSIYNTNSYSGFRFGAGLQFTPVKNFRIGTVLTLPSVLSGVNHFTVSQLDESSVSDSQDVDDFKFPMEFGIGVQHTFNEQLTLAFDFKRNLWDETQQSDQLGTFVNQNTFGLGVEFRPHKNPLNYRDYIQYRAGLNYDSGFLEIKDKTVQNYAFNLGIGLPLKHDGASMLNIAYSYGKKGQVYDGLIQENYHLLTLNISLEGRWFVKRKIN